MTHTVFVDSLGFRVTWQLLAGFEEGDKKMEISTFLGKRRFLVEIRSSVPP